MWPFVLLSIVQFAYPHLDMQAISEGSIVDSYVYYTVEDRPVVKERTTQYLDKQLLVKEFEKEVFTLSLSINSALISRYAVHILDNSFL